MYDIHKEPYNGKLLLADRTRGPKPRFPFREMAVGDWIRVLVQENRQLWIAARNVKRSYGIEIQVHCEDNGQYFVARRVK